MDISEMSFDEMCAEFDRLNSAIEFTLDSMQSDADELNSIIDDIQKNGFYHD